MALIDNATNAGASAQAAGAAQYAYEQSLKNGMTQPQASAAAADAGSTTYNTAVSTPATVDPWNFNTFLKNPVLVISSGILIVGILRLFKKHKD